MHDVPHALQRIAATQRNLVTRPQLAEVGWSDRRTDLAVAEGWHGGKGRRGTTLLREIVALYAGTKRPPGSGGEVAFLRELRRAGIEEPVRQFEVMLLDGSKAVVDFAWPDRRKLVEFVGVETHADSRAHAHDTLREDDILTATGWELRRFAPETLRTNPVEVARRVTRFLGAGVHPLGGPMRPER